MERQDRAKYLVAQAAAETAFTQASLVSGKCVRGIYAQTPQASSTRANNLGHRRP